jgi:predicted lipoprotein with Yx(FWY)xxD motif
LLGTITRDDGTTQVTYNGHPLYYYADDVNAGDTLGQGRGDVWYVLDAQGNQIQ